MTTIKFETKKEVTTKHDFKLPCYFRSVTDEYLATIAFCNYGDKEFVKMEIVIPNGIDHLNEQGVQVNVFIEPQEVIKSEIKTMVMSDMYKQKNENVWTIAKTDLSQCLAMLPWKKPT